MTIFHDLVSHNLFYTGRNHWLLQTIKSSRKFQWTIFCSYVLGSIISWTYQKDLKDVWSRNTYIFLFLFWPSRGSVHWLSKQIIWSKLKSLGPAWVQIYTFIKCTTFFYFKLCFWYIAPYNTNLRRYFIICTENWHMIGFIRSGSEKKFTYFQWQEAS